MLNVLFFFILYILIIAITMPNPAVEGFNTYFRQTVRPHMRNIKGFTLDIGGNTKKLLVSVGRVFGLS
jgi:hypothetical protein